MANQDQQPLLSQNPAESASALTALSAFMRHFLMGVENMLPAQVVSYDRVKNVATVQPLISMVRVDDVELIRHQIQGVQVLSYGGGGFNINFPLAAGDLGWIIAADRDLSDFKTSLARSVPTTGRLHSFNDSWFVPDVFRKYTIDGSNSGSMVIQSLDGSNTVISLSPGGHIKIKSATDLTIDTPTTTITGDVIIDKTLTVVSNVTMQANATVTGQTAVNGGFTAAGGQTCSLPATTTVSGKTVNGHVHGGVQSGTSNTNGF